jgi:hypothetical protein
MDCRTGAHLEPIDRLAPRRTRFNCVHNSLAQLQGAWLRHRSALQNPNQCPPDSTIQACRGIPIQPSRNPLQRETRQDRFIYSIGQRLGKVQLAGFVAAVISNGAGTHLSSFLNTPKHPEFVSLRLGVFPNGVAPRMFASVHLLDPGNRPGCAVNVRSLMFL